MTKDFREAVERLPSENTKHIDLQLQSLFGDLKSRTAKTNDITKKLGIKDVSRQQDAAEYYEKILRLTSDDASKIFHGQLTHMTRCSSCGTKTGADRAFWHLPLVLEESYLQIFCVEKGIEEFFRASHSNGENQMYCDGCRAKSDATTKCVIKHHPEVLTLLLKRFEFDHYSNSYVKVNCTVDVPFTLQIPENQPYELYAMVEHSGDLRSGHYIATIKSEDDGRWYSFNDRWVTELDSQPFQSDKVEKSSSAYLLFYRKEKVPAAGTQDQSPAKRREREEAEGTAEEGKDAAATAFIDRDEGRGIKDKARVTSRKPGLSPDISNVESKEGQQKMWQAYGADVEQQGDGLRTETDVEVDKKGKTDPFPLIEDRRVDGRKQNMSEDRQGIEARRRREDRRDIEGAKEQKRGDDKHVQRTETSMTEDQDRRGLDDVRQQKTSVPHVTPEDVDEERPAKEQERKPFPNRGDSSRKQFIVKTIEEETIKTCSGTQRSIETKIIVIKTREKPAQQERLSYNFSDMKLSEQQKPGTKRHIVNVPTSAIDSNAERKPKVSDTQEQAAENQHAMKEIGEEEIISRGHHALKEKNGKGKKKKTISCIWKPCKHANQTSESD
ncbi:probable ubiquitin carboxyl-terminal hydrolase creB [Notothenia coriiceps]|uniref:Probable ubiquitin carboxyl-terminal hydrolase creB n=1 Tax=Notothenia coriiceps TaxID=8208 RepID=A0A6I9NFI6_9TELE|nr:PREDICTED: probable ubiquitin carboxyl-terminal hydrolase creB [Notothenia coriiceps]